MSLIITKETLAGLKKYWSASGQPLHWPSIFVLPQWLQVWWQVFGSKAEMMVRTVRAGDRVVGIAPLMRLKDTALLIGDPEICDYLDFIISPGLEEEFFSLILDELKINGLCHLELKHFRPDSPILKSLVPLAEKRGYAVMVIREAVSLEIDLPSSWEVYMDSLSAKQRHEVRRKLRRLAEKGTVEFFFLSEAGAISKAMNSFFHMFVESRQDKALFLTEKMKSFFSSLTASLSESGLMKLGLLTLSGKPVAEILCFDYNNTLYLYNSAYDPDFKNFSAGLCSKILSIESAIKAGKKKFDFLKGHELYKYHLGGKEVPLYRCQITIP
jgi:CelD/BcsL family acetyltransferase involved in cellulose biosynthesis